MEIVLKKIALILILLLTVDCSCTKNTQISRAKNEYFNNLVVVEKFLNNKGKKRSSDGKKLINSIVFLSSLTGIDSNFIEGFEITLVPTDKNLKDWKFWYKKNQDKLYWDEVEQKVKVKNE